MSHSFWASYKEEFTLLIAALKNPLTYIVAALIISGGYFKHMDHAGIVGLVLFSKTAAPLFVIDMRHKILPDILTIPGILFGLITAHLCFDISFIQVALGAVVGYAFFAAIYYGMHWLKGQEAMGYGDVKLLAMLGAWCGVLYLPLVLLIACCIALGAFVLRWLIKREGGHVPLPFGPFLIVGAYICLLYGPQLWHVVYTLRMGLLNMLV